MEPTDAAKVAERLEVRELPDESRGLGRANVAPTQQVLVARSGDDGERVAELARWGLAPRWAKLKGGPNLINARDDKLTASGAWKRYISKPTHRVLVPASCWIEWLRPEDPKATRQPFCHRIIDTDMFCFAALWTCEQPKDAEEPIPSVTLITTSANREAARVHDRMPVILDGPQAERAWLTGDLDTALGLVAPFPDGRTDVCAIDPKINSSRYEGLELLTPISVTA